jgi:hypothetical protein
VHDADEPLIFMVLRGGKTFTADLGRLGRPKAGKKAMTKPAPEPEPNPEPEADSGPKAESEPKLAVTPTTEAR